MKITLNLAYKWFLCIVVRDSVLVFFHHHYQQEGKIPTLHGSSAYRDPFCHRPLVFIITQLNAVVCSL